MRYVRVVETANDVYDCVHFSYMRKEFVAESFAFACALDKTRDVHKFKRSRGDFLAVVKSGKFFESFVGNGNYAYIRLDRAERIVRRLRARLCDCVEKRTLAHVWQTNDTEFHISTSCTFSRANFFNTIF